MRDGSIRLSFIRVLIASICGSVLKACFRIFSMKIQVSRPTEGQTTFEGGLRGAEIVSA